MTTEPTSPNRHPDLLSVLTAIRPDTSNDLLGDAEHQAGIRDRITATAPTATAPTATALGTAGADELTRRRRRRRPLVGITAAAIVLTGGVGAAAAGGLMPQAFVDAFTGWLDFPAEGGTRAVDPATAQRAATAQGPDGAVFSVLTATAADDPDYTCTVALFETPASAAQPGPADFTEASGNWCTSQPATGAFGSGTNVDVTEGNYVWWTAAGDAARAELITGSGDTYPVVLVDGNLYGWFPEPAADAPAAQLVGYASDGTEVGRTTI